VRLLPGCAADVSPIPAGIFAHGVASGDPLSDGVILWTRISADVSSPSSANLEVDWEMSLHPAFESIAFSGATSTDESKGFTIKIDVRGLAAATTYYYRFRFDGEDSPVGRTRTAPVGQVDRLRFALVSCSSLCQGHFHAYRSIAARADLDAVIHVGDYIYEFASGEYGSVRGYEPAHELYTLADYRARYAQYRRDIDLKEVHWQHPFITTWDDHEAANDSWHDGALNHMPDEGSWEERKAVASRAYREWMPFRERESDPAPLALWRVLRCRRPRGNFSARIKRRGCSTDSQLVCALENTRAANCFCAVSPDLESVRMGWLSNCARTSARACAVEQRRRSGRTLGRFSFFVGERHHGKSVRPIGVQPCNWRRNPRSGIRNAGSYITALLARRCAKTGGRGAHE
jgi:hypothetical protein